MRTLRIQSLMLSALLTLAAAAEAQLSEFPFNARAGESIRLSGLFTSTCFTGRVSTEIDGADIRLVFEEGCGPCAEFGPFDSSFVRYLPPLPAGAYSLQMLRRSTPACGSSSSPVGGSRTFTVRPSRYQLRTDPVSPVEGQDVFLDVASECSHDAFELAPGTPNVLRVAWFPTPILPPPCDTAPIHVTRFSLGALARGSHVVLLGALGSNDGPLLESLAFEVRRPETQTLDVQGGRFRITAHWQSTAGASGAGTAVPLTTDSGAFWFFRPDNLELLFKVLNGCAVNGKYWVLGAGLTDVGVEIEIEDTLTGATWTHQSPVGEPFAPVQDTGAFGCS